MELERVIDLDQAAAVISERAAGWLAAGLTVGQVTWMDANSPWPRQFESDRALVPDPVSIGVLIDGPGDAGLSVVLFRGGWADVEYFDGIDDCGQIPAFDITSAAAFGTQLDQWVPRAFKNFGKS
ncbi:hypothetical protein ACWEPA_25030 [Streptomyces filamentosus]